MSLPIDPRAIDVVRWASETTTVLLPYGFVPVLRDPAQWQQWARYVLLIPAVAGLGTPRPEGYSDWRKWAEAFNVTVRLLAS